MSPPAAVGAAKRSELPSRRDIHDIVGDVHERTGSRVEGKAVGTCRQAGQGRAGQRAKLRGGSAKGVEGGWGRASRRTDLITAKLALGLAGQNEPWSFAKQNWGGARPPQLQLKFCPE